MACPMSLPYLSYSPYIMRTTGRTGKACSGKAPLNATANSPVNRHDSSTSMVKLWKNQDNGSDYSKTGR